MATNSHAIRVAIGSAAPRESMPATPHGPAAPGPECQTPPTDIHEGPEGLILEVDLPGATEQNLTVQVEDNVLTLHARVEPPAPGGARLLHEEFRHGEFARSFILSDEVDRDRITAELKLGVLRLTLPRAERAKTRRIEVRSS